MVFNPNLVANIETQAQNRQSRRLVLKQDDTLKGQIDPLGGGTEPAGIMVKGPFDQNPLVVKLQDLGGVANSVIMEATYDLDYVEVTIDSTTALTPRRTAADAAPTWENVFTQALVELGNATQVINWGTLGLSQDISPTAIRFRFLAPGTGSGKEVKIEIEEGIL